MLKLLWISAALFSSAKTDTTPVAVENIAGASSAWEMRLQNNNASRDARSKRRWDNRNSLNTRRQQQIENRRALHMQRMQLNDNQIQQQQQSLDAQKARQSRWNTRSRSIRRPVFRQP